MNPSLPFPTPGLSGPATAPAPPSDDAHLRETLKRYSPATLEAVRAFRTSGDFALLPTIVTGVIEPRNALIFAIALQVLAFAVLWAGANLLSAVLAFSAAAFYVGVYTLWLKRTSRQNIVIGGAAGGVELAVGVLRRYVASGPAPTLSPVLEVRQRLNEGGVDAETDPQRG